jgi:hypothetical protein
MGMDSFFMFFAPSVPKEPVNFGRYRKTHGNFRVFLALDRFQWLGYIGISKTGNLYRISVPFTPHGIYPVPLEISKRQEVRTEADSS